MQCNYIYSQFCACTQLEENEMECNIYVVRGVEGTHALLHFAVLTWFFSLALKEDYLCMA